MKPLMIIALSIILGIITNPVLVFDKNNFSKTGVKYPLSTYYDETKLIENDSNDNTVFFMEIRNNIDTNYKRHSYIMSTSVNGIYLAVSNENAFEIVVMF